MSDRVRHCLDRITARDAAVRGWVYVDEQATQLPGTDAGELSGLTAGIKDVIDVAGMVTSHGSAIFAANRAGQDAEAVRRLRAAGALQIFTDMSELPALVH